MVMEEGLEDLWIAIELGRIVQELRSEDRVVSAGVGHGQVRFFDRGAQARHRNNFNWII